MSNKDKLNLGSVQVHRKVLHELVFNAVDEIDGVSWTEDGPMQKLYQLFGLRNFKGVQIKVNDQQEVNIEVKVFIRYGLNIPDMAKKVQDTIRQVLDKTVNINLKEIDVNIQGIERGTK